MMSATIQPNNACGPPIAVMRSGIVMNGPTPIMFAMLSAVAGRRPKRRLRCGPGGGAPSVSRSGEASGVAGGLVIARQDGARELIQPVGRGPLDVPLGAI